MKYTFTALFTIYTLTLSAQTNFTKITDPTNAIVNHPTSTGYIGCSWIDFDDDGWMDLFATPNRLYINQRNGTFTAQAIQNSSGPGIGCTWGDVDNDGDLDLFIAANPCQFFRNQNGTLTPESLTNIQVLNFRGWSGTWGDYNNDGWLDLFVTHPSGFVGNPTNNFLFENGGGTFTQIQNVDPVTGFAAYTVGNWSDYDMDGDIDLFVGSGEINFQSQDHIYKNQLIETGTADLNRLTTGNLATDLRDGQNWNFIDYDNDGDLDGFVTNYISSVPNHLYRNDDGAYTKLTTVQAGSIANQTGAGLANIWGDFDNDGDLDAFILFDGNSQDRFYDNNGDGTFTEINNALSQTGASRGVSAGDYNNDGFLDIYITSSTNATKGLFRNDGNSNHWVNIRCEGTQSNWAAIGTLVKAKATINGMPTWQIREITAQNSFNGHNSFRVHLGLGDATMIDSMIVRYPSGIIDTFTNIPADNFYHAVEGNSHLFGQVITSTQPKPNVDFKVDIFPNPVVDKVNIRWKAIGKINKVNVLDATGRLILQQLNLETANQTELSISSLPTGTYYLEFAGEEAKWSHAFVKQ